MSAHFLKLISLFIILSAVSLNCMAQSRIDEMMRITDQGDYDQFTSFMAEIRNRRLINIPDSSESTALMFASYRGHEDIVHFLLRAGADIDEQNKNGTTPLIAAVGQNNERVVQILLDRGANPNERNNDGDTALMIAIRYGKLDVIDDLLIAGSFFGGEDIYNVQNSDLYLELMMISTSGYRLDIVQYLLEEEVIDVNAQNEIGVTALMVASMYNATGIAGYLLEMGADPNIPDQDGNTALMPAVTGPNKIEIVNALLEAGADPNIPNEDGNTALMPAVTGPNKIEIVNALLEAGADPNIPDQDGNTALMSAVTGPDKIEIVDALLEAGADPNVLSGNRNNEENEAVAEWMPRSENQDNSATPLMIASLDCDNLDVINRLLEAGADPFGENRSGETARLWILTRNHNHNSYECLQLSDRLVTAMMERRTSPTSPRPTLPLPWQR